MALHVLYLSTWLMSQVGEDDSFLPSHLSPDCEGPLARGDARHGLLYHHHLIEVEQDAGEVADLISRDAFLYYMDAPE